MSCFPVLTLPEFPESACQNFRNPQTWEQFGATVPHCCKRRSGFEAEKCSHAIQLRLEFALEDAIARWVRFDIAEVRLKVTILQREVAPADHAVAPKQRQSIIAALAFVRRSIGFETVHPAPQQLETRSV